MIVTGSRYYGQAILSVPVDESTNASAIFRPPPTSAPTSFFYYTVVDGDRLDSIAFAVYGAPELWWRLADANPEVFYPDSLNAGMIIRIPT